MTKEEKKEYDRKYYQKNKNKKIKSVLEYRDNNRDAVNKQRRKHYSENKEEIYSKRKDYISKYRKNRRNSEPLYKMKDNIRALIYKSIKNENTNNRKNIRMFFFFI